MKFLEYLKDNIVIFDGAMGTQIQDKGLPLGSLPESFNLEHPSTIQAIHKAYVQAGARVVSTNTFGASPYKLKDLLDVQTVIEKGVALAKESGAYVALDLGPTGKMMQPLGELTFDEAYESYKTQVLHGASADLVLVETMSDLNEVRAAVLAVKENTDLPVIVSMTFQEDGRTLTGVTPESYVYAVEALGVDGLGVNCSLGPEALVPIVERITAVASVPVIVQANAGLPEVRNGQTLFNVTPKTYADYIQKFVALGVRMIGGCCGTGPEHIEAMASLIEERCPYHEKIKTHKVCSQTQVLDFSDFVIIGERINPTGNKKLKTSLRSGSIKDCVKEAIVQNDHGIHVLDVNVGLPDIDEVAVMSTLVDTLSHVVPSPLQIDSSKSKVIEAGLRRFPGVAIINSVNGKQKSMDRILPLAKKYGAFVICLTMDETGIPDNAEDRVAIAEKIINEAAKYGIDKSRLIIDCLVLTVSAQQKEVMETIRAIQLLKEKHGVKTTLGISNVSYGMPNRKLLTRTFMTLARSAGLDSAIMDPTDLDLRNVILATDVLLNRDPGGEAYIQEVAEVESVKVTEDLSLYDMVLRGYKDQVDQWTRKTLEDKKPLEIVDGDLIPTLDRIGNAFEAKQLFLPQLIRAAETIGAAFDVIKSVLSASDANKGTIVMATVKGDVHDIGKNLVKILLENYGFQVMDLGKDVAPEKIVETVIKHDVKLVGLSALMTTTVISMEETIQMLHEAAPGVSIFVGGAVLTPEYAKTIGADHYCKDAKASVEVAKKFFLDLN